MLLGDAEALPGSRLLEERLRAQCLNLAGKVSLTMLGALIARLSILVTNDSGPAHIAYALRAPVVTLFGSSSGPQTNGSLQPGPFRLLIPDSPEETTDGPTNQAAPLAIRRIPVARVISVVEELLEYPVRYAHVRAAHQNVPE